MYFVFIQLLSSGSAWFAILLMVVTCLFIDVVKKVFDRQLHPTSTEKAQMEEDQGSVGSAYEPAESQHRGEDSRHLLAEAGGQQDSACVH